MVLETFILFEDKVGLQLHEALVAAARRGVQVDMTIDGFGSPDLSRRLHRLAASTRACASMCSTPASACWAGASTCCAACTARSSWSTASVAFVGGINYSADHLADFGPEAKQDYSVEIHGPLVAEIHRFTHAALAQGQRYQRRPPVVALPQAACAAARTASRTSARPPPCW